MLQVGTLTFILAVVSAAIAWIGGLMLIAYRIGKFETAQNVRMDAVEASSKENRGAITHAEEVLRQEIKDATKGLNYRIDGIYHELRK